jgi:hypothetical protein
MQAELEEQKGKEQREVFETALVGLLERAKEEKLVRVTQHDVRLYLIENSIGLKGNVGMLTLAANKRLGAKELKREDIQELRRTKFQPACPTQERTGSPASSFDR